MVKSSLCWRPVPMVSCLSHICLFVIQWTVDCQAPLSLGLSRQEYWSGLPCLPPGDLPDPEIKPTFLLLLHWQAGSLPLATPEKPLTVTTEC